MILYDEKFAHNHEPRDVYVIRNMVNGKMYIGSTANAVDQRIKAHFSALSNGKHTSTEFQKDYDEYGINAFRIHVIATEDEGGSYKKELELIDFFDTNNPEYGYNRDWSMLEIHFSYERYETLRDCAGITDADVSAATGISTQTMYRWKKGASPRKKTSAKLANLFGVPVERLCSVCCRGNAVEFAGFTERSAASKAQKESRIGGAT